MATYKQIQEWVKKNCEYSVKNCWIANVKEICGLPLRKAPNRIDENKRSNPCPRDKIEPIKKAFEYYKMI